MADWIVPQTPPSAETHCTLYRPPAIDGQLARFRELGANAVSLMPFAYQSRPDDPRLRFLNDSPTSETDVGVLYAARRARAA